MDPNELLAAGTAVAKIAAGSIPFTGIVKRMLGPAADEVAEMCRDSVRVYRYGRQLKLLEKSERMAQEAGYTPNAVPLKILFPLLEGASFEDNEDMHDMWAALLANASRSDNMVHPSFIDILKQLRPIDAKFLAVVYGLEQPDLQRSNVLAIFGSVARTEPPDQAAFGITFDNLMRLRLLQSFMFPTFGGAVNDIQKTDLGRAFVSACTAPK
jgi:hypothetical protein